MTKREIANRAEQIAFAGMLGCGLAVGGVAVASVAPTAPQDQAGIVQIAQAQSQGARAKAAYRSFLAGSSYMWGRSYSSSNYRFATADINGDKVPELFVENIGTYYAAGYSRVFQYRNGRVQLLQGFSLPPSKLYKKAHVLYYEDQHTSSYWGRYFTMSSGKLKFRAGWSASDFPSGKYHFTGYTVNGKKASKAAYRKQVSRLLKKGEKATGFEYHVNTSASRARYL